MSRFDDELPRDLSEVDERLLGHRYEPDAMQLDRIKLHVRDQARRQSHRKAPLMFKATRRAFVTAVMTGALMVSGVGATLAVTG